MYKPILGLEVHIELNTKSKMFCSCPNDPDKIKPNTNICPVCTAQPGTLPVINKEAVEKVIKTAQALNCKIQSATHFERKNYFYPDLPKGYQISQYAAPLSKNGYLKVTGGKKIGIERIHLEEDTGKLVHPEGTDYSLVDFNRAGVPLMELVTEPDIETGEEARIFCQKLQQICRYLEISDADMEKGNMRCEVNISLREITDERGNKSQMNAEFQRKPALSPRKSAPLGTKVEVKNINSFKFVEKAINFEIERQTEMLDKGEKIVQETRGWDANKGETVSQRKKESAHDYRYFPEPDIPPFSFDEKYINDLKRKLPELPAQKEERFQKEYNLPAGDVDVLTNDKDLAEYFEQVVSEIKEKIKCKEYECVEDKAIKLSANYVITELRKYMVLENHKIQDLKITPENYAELICIVAGGKINSSAAQTVLAQMYATGGDPSQIIEEKNLAQMDNLDELEKIVDEILAKNEKSVVDFKAGKENALKFLIGQTMAMTKGKANPQIVQEIVKNKLK